MGKGEEMPSSYAVELKLPRECAWCHPDAGTATADAEQSWGICWNCLVKHFPGVFAPHERRTLFPADSSAEEPAGEP